MTPLPMLRCWTGNRERHNAVEMAYKFVCLFVLVLLLEFSHQHKPRRCFLPPETGPCKAAFTKYFFNATSNECETFTYGGCQGNRNRFETLELCQYNCQ
ncbi:hypothetical protein Btru_045269 [Bulinus truncatus]|nr:hypothetical protein Btru_045269 [Bulinus truncatus]